MESLWINGVPSKKYRGSPANKAAIPGFTYGREMEPHAAESLNKITFGKGHKNLFMNP